MAKGSTLLQAEAFTRSGTTELSETERTEHRPSPGHYIRPDRVPSLTGVARGAGLMLGPSLFVKSLPRLCACPFFGPYLIPQKPKRFRLPLAGLLQEN